jgi:hypothetical protein
MNINQPCIITARLLPEIRVADATISIEYGDWTADGRQGYRYYIDGPGLSHEGDDLSSGCGGGTLLEGLRSLLSFLGACGDSIKWTRPSEEPGEHADLFPPEVAEWCGDNADELAYMSYELEETKDAIQE